MIKNKYSQTIILDPVEISSLSIQLRSDIQRVKKDLQKVDIDEKAGVVEYLENLIALQKKFQRLAVKIEKEVLSDLKKGND